MTTWMDELAASVASVAATATPSVVRLGGWRGANGLVIGPGKVLTNAHNVHRGDGHGTLRGRPDRGGDGGRASTPTATSPCLTSRPVTRPPCPGPWMARPSRSGPRCSRSRARTPGPGSRSGSCRRSRARSGARGDDASRVPSSTRHRWRVAAPAAPSSMPRDSLVGLNTNRLEGGLYLALPTDAALRARVTALGEGAGAPSRPDWASASLPPGPPGGCAARWACRSATGCWSATSMRMATRHGPASRWATSSWRPTARPVPDADELADALAAADGSVELTVVRGVEERQVQVVLM